MKLSLKAPAKINLGLSILGKLPNNYHEVKTIYTQISLFDLIEMEEVDSENVEIKANWQEVPIGKSNLVWQAVELIKQEMGIKKGVKIKLEKRIPIGSGLGGGSSDAAAVLKGLNTMWKLGLSEDDLVRMAGKIGADVGYQVVGGVKLEVQGGEKAGVFSDLGRLPECELVVWVSDKKRTSVEAYKEVDYELIGRNDLEELIKAIRIKDLSLIGRSLSNDFESWVLRKHPEVREVKELMMKSGAAGSLMSGKGLTVFGLFKEKARAKEGYNRLEKKGKVYLVKPVYD